MSRYLTQISQICILIWMKTRFDTEAKLKITFIQRVVKWNSILHTVMAIHSSKIQHVIKMYRSCNNVVKILLLQLVD